VTGTRTSVDGVGAQDRRLPVVTGAGAILGGAAWVTACVIHASQPSGCVGDADCSRVAMREATYATSLLLAAAGALLVASGGGLLLLIRRDGRLGRGAVLGSASAAVGVLLLVVAVTVQALFFDGDFALMPALVVPGIALLAVGLVLVGWSVIRSEVLPRWAGIALASGAVLLVGANEQTDAVLLAVPFGVAWLVTGLALCGRRARDRPRAGSAGPPAG
jgi:uncharacterized membrane protein YhaH (DUF805 family)